jgi:2-polyprenyl-3-methyl-5-hydroxy-6-metoxy-1,4-benzoquinol methylase
MLYWNLLDKYVPYQRIVYKGRVLLRGRDRTEAYRLVFPTPPIGKAVLDVGCHSGFYCFMAASEGASQCVGVDMNPKHLSRGESILERYAIPNVRFIRADALALTLSDSFDVVLCLNVLQHQEDIYRVRELLRKLLVLTRGELVLIFPTTRDLDHACSVEYFNKRRYLLVSANYIAEAVRPCHLLQMNIPARLYGPNKVLARVLKCESPIEPSCRCDPPGNNNS